MVTAFYAAYAAASVLLFIVALTTLVWTVEAWKTPDELEQIAFVPPDEPRLSFSLIVPARHEEGVLGRTLDNLAALDHPAVEILSVVGHDDPATQQVAYAAAWRHPGKVRVLLDGHPDKTKPKALNSADL